MSTPSSFSRSKLSLIVSALLAGSTLATNVYAAPAEQLNTSQQQNKYSLNKTQTACITV
ncbi:MAG: hypothetical protein HRT51_19750 [Colwellia sp.]|nr:hypothetical protein [Colwellia sp.]